MNEQNEHIEQKSAYDSLEEVYQRAVDLRLDHKPHKSIAEILSKTGFKVKEHTVRVWFMKGGKCYDAFNEIREIRMNDLKELIERRDVLIEDASAKALVITNIILKNALENDTFTPFVFRVCQDALDRGGFPKKTAQDTTSDVELRTKEDMARIARGIDAIIGVEPDANWDKT